MEPFDLRTIPDDRLDEAAAEVAAEGWTILDDAIDPARCDEIADELARLTHERSIGPGDNVFEGTRTTRIYNLLVHGPVFERIPVHPNVLPVVERVLDDGLLVSSLSSISIGPGEAAQLLHADDQLIPLPRPHPPIICNTMWAITDFTAANGATRLVPRSHLSPELPEMFGDYAGLRQAEMPKGSVLVWVGSLWHGGGANTTAEDRVGIAMNYCAGFIRQQENQQLGIPRSVARGFDRRLQQLVGYSIYHGLLGHIDKQHPAKAALGAEDDADLIWDAGKRVGPPA